jgi:hypothetical protein
MTDARNEKTAAPEHKVYISKTAMHWIFECLFIVVGVALGFAVAEYGQSRQERRLVVSLLHGLHDEIAYNITQLEPAIRKHRQWGLNLSAWLNAHAVKGAPPSTDVAAYDTFLNTWPNVDRQKLDLNNLELPFPTLRRAAWDAAVSSGALRLMDYEVMAAVSELYGWQNSLPTIPSDDVEFFDREHHVPATLRTAFAMEALIISENTLLNLYRKHLPAIRAAADSAD